MRMRITVWALAALLAVAGALGAADEAVNLGAAVNSAENDFGPIVTADGNKLYFTSDRDGGKGGQDIWVSERANGVWGQAQNLGAPINTEFHEGPDSLSVDEKTMYFTRCDQVGKPGICDVFTATWDDAAKQWTNIARLSANVNSDYNDSNASISADGKTLYFVSNRPGDAAKQKLCGEGAGDNPLAKNDYDIFKSAWDGKDWSPAERLGEPVSTCGDEFHVIIHQDNQTLYFSSNGLKGLGGADIFRAKIADGKFGAPENLGQLVNTGGDDTYFTIPASGDLAYFASDRAGTQGMLDIYSVPVPVTMEQAPAVFFLSGIVADKKSCSDDKDMATCKPAAKATVTITQGGTPVVSKAASADGRFKFPLVVGASYNVSASAPGFKPASATVDATKFQPYAQATQNLLLEAE